MQFGLILHATGLLLTCSAAGDWPEFRGPERNGHAASTRLPISWNETNNIAWKTAIHDLGWSSPVVNGKQAWITTATKNGREMCAVCVDIESGKVIHDIKVFDTPDPQHVASVNSYASPTSAIEVGRVYVHYGTYGTACVDTRNGKVLWSRRDLNCYHHEGPGASLLLDDLLYMVNDQGYALCIEATTGNVIWRERLNGKHSASPIYASGRIYFFSEKNLTTVVAPGREFRVLAENQLESTLMATPAVVGDALILRSKTHLYRIEERSHSNLNLNAAHLRPVRPVQQVREVETISKTAR